MHVVANVAVSADGKLSSRRREQVVISGPADFARVDSLRASCDAVLVGVGTVLADDPHLAVEDPALRAERTECGDPTHPARVVVDTHARTPAESRILDDAAATYVLVGESASKNRCAALREAGANVIAVGENRVDIEAGVAALENEGIDRLMVEGGGEILFSAFEAGLVDELSTFVGSLVIGGRDAPTLADGAGFVEDFPELRLEDVERMDGGVACHYAVE